MSPRCPEPIHRSPRPTAFLPAFALALTLGLAPAAGAQVWNELPDAGSSIATAQTTVGVGPLTTINGQLATPEDVDIYCVQLGLTPRALNLPVVALACVINQGPVVRVFDSNGIGLAVNETCLGGNKLITTTTLAGPATIYVAVSNAGVDPFSAGGPIWLPALPGERLPDGPGGAGALAGWAGTPSPGPLNPYQITLGYSGFCDAATPARANTWGELKVRYRD